MGKLTWDEARALVDLGSRPWGLPKGTPASIQRVRGFGGADTDSELVRRVVNAVREAMQASETKHR